MARACRDPPSSTLYRSSILVSAPFASSFALVAPSQGGHLYELDVRPICHNLLATLTRREEAYQELNRQVFGGLVARTSDSITVSSLLGTPGTVATASLGHGCRSWVLAARAGMTGASTSQMAITPPPTRTASIATAASTPLTSAGRSRMGALPATSTPGPTA